MEKWFCLLGRLEGTSFLALLGIAMPLKYLAHNPMAVKVLGPIHGILFLLYCALACYLALEQNWPRKKHFLAYLSAVIPFGPFLFEKTYGHKKQDLAQS